MKPVDEVRVTLIVLTTEAMKRLWKAATGKEAGDWSIAIAYVVSAIINVLYWLAYGDTNWPLLGIAVIADWLCAIGAYAGVMKVARGGR